MTVTAAPPAQTSTPPPAETGQWITDGPLSFKVAEAYEYTMWAGDNPPPPATKVVYVGITVANVSGIPQTYRAADQMLRDDRGRLFATTAATTASDKGRIDLNPGTSRDMVWLDFDVPIGTDVSQYVFVGHSSPHSVGVAVRLR